METAANTDTKPTTSKVRDLRRSGPTKPEPPKAGAPKPPRTPGMPLTQLGTKQAQQLQLPGTAARTPSSAPVVRRSHDIPATADNLLLKILSWRRKHDTYSERAFRDWLMVTAVELTKGHAGAVVCLKTEMKQVVVSIPQADGKASDVLFSSHIDTQDHVLLPPKPEGIADHGVFQPLVYDTSFGHIALDTKPPEGSPPPGGCLGADDGVGVWIMLNMMAAGIPGSYVFHRGEECGGLGAAAMLKDEREWLSRHSMAVAFDRPRYDEVIITQGGAVCASLKFGEALADAINAADPEKLFDFRTSHNGVFTDVKIYRGVIAECVNLGVGYENQHDSSEFQDYAHAANLLKACLAVAWHSLPIDRDPTEVDVFDRHTGCGRGYWVGVDYDTDSKSGAARSGSKKRPSSTGTQTSKTRDEPMVTPVRTTKDELDGMSIHDLEAFVADNPDDAARVLAELMADLTAAEACIKVYKDLLEIA